MVHFETCNAGMTCDEYTTLMFAGLNDVPWSVRERMMRHYDVCKYHRSAAFVRSAADSIVTPEIQQAAQEIIAKYRS